MISVEGLKVEFNATPLFEDVSYVINKKDRIALVGKNGAGKSTMLKILAGIQQPTAGIVAVPRECTIGYLPQVMILSDRRNRDSRRLNLPSSIFLRCRRASNA